MNSEREQVDDDEYDGPWATDRIHCTRCGYTKQVAVHPMCERVECVRCHYLTQTPPHVDAIAMKLLGY